jgi:DNA-binding transcriptional MerR regulator|tara:strand:+ start:926 stop:1321 length:396 start_codon:yes stop_codon:yes gene_type:complete
MRPQKEKTFSISDLRKEFNVTSRTIRYYEDISLLNPNRCGKSRIYSPADRTRLKLILRGKRLGLSLEDSRQIIDMYEPGNNNVQQLITLINAIREQRKKLNRQLDDIHNLLADLKTAESDCQQALTAISKE